MSATLLSIPAEIGATVFAILLAVSFVGSFITVVFGIGGGALVLAVLATLMPPAALIPVHGIVQLGSNATRFAMLFRDVKWAAIVPGFALGSLAGCALGGVVVVELPPRLVQAGVGGFVIWSVLARPPKWLSAWPWLTGGISSFLTMFFGATGLFVGNYTKSLNLPRHGHVASHAAMMTLQHGVKVAIFGLLGFAFSAWASVIAGMILAGALGTWIGKAALGRISDMHFKRALDVILVLISLQLIWAGLFGSS